MKISTTSLVRYLEQNLGKKYPIGPDSWFTYELSEPSESGRGTFPLTIRFESPRWSESTNRSAGPKAIVRHLETFNSSDSDDGDGYRNLGPKRSKSASARYLIILFKDLMGQDAR